MLAHMKQAHVSSYNAVYLLERLGNLADAFMHPHAHF